jgi:hypothetical protein
MSVVARRLLATVLVLARNRRMDERAVLAALTIREIGANLCRMVKFTLAAVSTVGKVRTLWLLFHLSWMHHGNIVRGAVGQRVNVHRPIIALSGIKAFRRSAFPAGNELASVGDLDLYGSFFSAHNTPSSVVSIAMLVHIISSSDNNAARRSSWRSSTVIHRGRRERTVATGPKPFIGNVGSS